jgi:cell division protein FtsL
MNRRTLHQCNHNNNNNNNNKIIIMIIIIIVIKIIIIIYARTSKLSLNNKIFSGKKATGDRFSVRDLKKRPSKFKEEQLLLDHTGWRTVRTT